MLSTGSRLVQLHPGDAEALLKDVGAVAGDRPGHATADVGVVGDADAEPDQPPLGKGGLDDEDVGRVARAVERVVDDVDVTGREGVTEALEQRLHRVRDRAELEGDCDRLRDRLPRRRAEGGRVVHRVAHDGRVSGAEDRRRHLVGDGRERVRDDRAEDRLRLGRCLLPRVCTLNRDVLEHERVVRRPRTTVHSGGTTTVVSYSSTSSGPSSGSSPIEARETTGASRRPWASPKSATRGRASPGAAGGVGAAARPPRGGPTTVRRSARITIGEPASRRVPYRRSCSASKRSINAFVSISPRRPGDVDGDVPVLSAVADVGRPEPLHLAEAGHPLSEIGAHLSFQPREPGQVGCPRVDAAEADVVKLRPGEQQADGREEAGERRHDRGAHAELGCEGRRVNRACAAVGDEDELPRVAPALGGDRAQGPHHRRVREAVDAAGGRVDGQAELLGHASYGRGGAVGRHRQVTRGERPGRDVAEDDVGVGHRRLLAAAPVAGGPRRGARAPRPDLQRPGGIEPGQAAAPRSDLCDVDRRDPDQLAAAAEEAAARGELGADLVLLAPRDAAVLDQRRLRRRTAHVERDRVVEPERLGEPERGDDAGRRAGLEGVDRADRRVGGRHHAPGGLHDLEWRRACEVGDARADVVEVAGHQRPDVRVHGRRRGALVLLLLAQDLGGERDRHVRQLRPQHLAQQPLVLGIEVGVEKADGNRFQIGRPKLPGDPPRLLAREGAHRLSGGRHPLVDLEAQPPRDERLGLAPEVVVEMWHPHPPQLEDVPKAQRRHDRRPRAELLEHRVRRHGRPVDDLRHGIVAKELPHRRDDAAVVRGRCREHLRARGPRRSPTGVPHP